MTVLRQTHSLGNKAMKKIIQDVSASQLTIKFITNVKIISYMCGSLSASSPK